MTSTLRSLILALCAAVPLHAQYDIVNYETAHVHPLELTASGTRLLAVSTPDSRLEVFTLSGGDGLPVHAGSIQVGLDPITVRALTDDIAWVVNNISDSISIVDVSTFKVLDTIQTPDEPSDVVFTGSATTGRAWVSCSQPDLVAVYDLASPHAPPMLIPILGEDPRAMAVSPGGDRVYVGIHTSGNNTTLLHGDKFPFMENVLMDPTGPWGGLFNPAPNSPTGYFPPLNPANPLPPPPAGLIVRKNAQGQWLDDFPRDWTAQVVGGNHDRVAGWDLYDHDVAILDVTTTPPTVSYGKGGMNIVMAIALQPFAGSHILTMVGTEATNEVRFEPNLKSAFVRSKLAAFEAFSTHQLFGALDLNPHLDYTQTAIPQADRDKSLGDPRAIVWHSDGAVGYIAGMGSNNVIAVNAGGGRIAEIEVGSGPTGLALDEPRARLYVLNKFASSISVVDSSLASILDFPFHDPTPTAVKRGRKHMYDTHRTSGLGQVACASCHVNGRDDGLAWDLGDPSAELRVSHAPNMSTRTGGVVPVHAMVQHPMKGPMVTQTLQDIIGHEPFHWRGDRNGLEEFNGAFRGLQGDDFFLSAAEMQEYEDFLASIAVPPNPHRGRVDNSLDQNFDLTKWNLHYHDGQGGLTPLTTGNALFGQAFFMALCASCHTPPVGLAPDRGWDGSTWLPIAPGGHGERHSALVVNDGASHAPLKVAPLRNMHEKTGFNAAQQMNTRGFGYAHDGDVDTISHFLSDGFRDVLPAGFQAQAVADLSAFMFSFATVGEYTGDPNSFSQPPAIPNLNSHPGTGRQWTVKSSALTAEDLAELTDLFATRDGAKVYVELIVKQNRVAGGQRGLVYVGSGNFADDTGSLVTGAQLLQSIGAGREATFTLVPTQNILRASIDRDADGAFDADEIALGTDPADPRSFPPAPGTACTIPHPAAPSSMTAAATGPYQVTVGWIDNSNDETVFSIERAWTNSPQWEHLADVGPNVTSFVDDSAGEQTGYVYRVRAHNCGGGSAYAVSNATTTGSSPTVETCHVHAIDLQIERRTSGPTPTRRAYGTVQVVNDQGRIIEGAVVTIQISGPTSTGTVTAITSDQGQAPFVTGFVDETQVGAGWTFTVTGIASGTTTVVYDANANFETSDTIQ